MRTTNFGKAEEDRERRREKERERKKRGKKREKERWRKKGEASKLEGMQSFSFLACVKRETEGMRVREREKEREREREIERVERRIKEEKI